MAAEHAALTDYILEYIKIEKKKKSKFKIV